LQRGQGRKEGLQAAAKVEGKSAGGERTRKAICFEKKKCARSANKQECNIERILRENVIGSIARGFREPNAEGRARCKARVPGSSVSVLQPRCEKKSRSEEGSGGLEGEKQMSEARGKDAV